MSDLEAIRERHHRSVHENHDWCVADNADWPCDTAQVQKALDRALDPRVLGMAMERAGDVVIVGAPSFAQRVATEVRDILAADQ